MEMELHDCRVLYRQFVASTADRPSFTGGWRAAMKSVACILSPLHGVVWTQATMSVTIVVDNLLSSVSPTGLASAIHVHCYGWLYLVRVCRVLT